MYAFLLELSPKCGAVSPEEGWVSRIEEEYYRRLSARFVSVKRVGERYEVVFEHEDYNFNWCFCVADDLKLCAIELTIPNIVIPSANPNGLQLHANGFFRAFPNAGRFPDLCCDLTIDPGKRFVKVRTEIEGKYPKDEYRSGMFDVVRGVMNLGRMTKWLSRLLDAHREENYGKAERAVNNLLKAMARSAPFLALP